MIAMYGATVGKLGVLQEKAATNQAICAIAPGELVERDYLDPELVLELGAALLNDNRSNEAIPYLVYYTGQTVEPRDTTDSLWVVGRTKLALAYSETNRATEAEGALRSIEGITRAETRDNAIVWSNLANVYRVNGLLSKAKELYERAIKTFSATGVQGRDVEITKAGYASVLADLGEKGD